MRRTQSRALGSHPLLPISLFSNQTVLFASGLLIFLVLVGLTSVQDGIKVSLLNNDVSTKKRWAVMMIGAGRSYMFTRNSFIQNVMMQADSPMDVFVFTRKNSNSSCLVDLEAIRLLENDSTVIHFDENFIEGEHHNYVSTEDRFVRQHNEALQMIDSYAEQQKIKYHYIFYTRPDLYYTVPFNIKALEEKINNATDSGINGTIFSPTCCSWKGWCDQLAAAKYQDFARMIRISREWFSLGLNIGSTVPEHQFQARGQFANLSNFDLLFKEDYGFFILRLTTARDQCHISHNLKAAFWGDFICNDYAPIDINATLETCGILNTSSVCDEGGH